MNPLDSIIEWHQAAYDALRITRRVINQKSTNIVQSQHVFHGMSDPDSSSRLDVAQGQLDQLTVLALVAVFERTLREYVVALAKSKFLNPSPTETKVLDNATDDIEFWNFSSRLVDLFENVDANIRGQVKQFIGLRNWIAHASYAKAVSQPQPVNVSPKDAYRVLTDYLQQAGLL